jgi:iron(III) transport system permease protein
MGRALTGSPERFTRLLAGAALLALIAPPLIAVTIEALSSPAELTRALSPRLLTLLGRSAAIAATTTLLALCLGVPLGALLARTRLHLAAIAVFVHALPLLMPPFITALAAFQLFGREGLLGSGTTARWLFSDVGCVLVLTVCFTPVLTLLTWLAARATDPSGDEAARIIAGPWRTLSGIVLPQAAPSISLGAIIVFVLAMAEVAAPMFLRVDVYGAAVFARLGGFVFAPGEAAVLTFPLVALSFLLWALERLIPGQAATALPSSHAGVFALLDRRRPQILVSLAAVVAAVIGAAPLIIMGSIAFEGDGFSEVWPLAANAVNASVLYGAAAGVLLVALAVALASTAREHPRFVGLVDAISWIGFLLPPALFAIGAILMWNRPALQWFYASAHVVVVALAGRYAVLALRLQLAAGPYIPAAMMEAARVSGAGYWRRLTHIYAPATGRFIAAAWLLVFVFCVRDIETTALLYPPGGEPLTVKLFTLEANGPPAVVAAMSVAASALIIVPLCVAVLLLRTRA